MPPEKKEQKEGQVELKEYTEKVNQYLPYRFNPGEKEALSGQLAQSVSDRSEAENKLQDVSKQIKADITRFESTIESLATKVRQGFEYRNIVCTKTKDIKASILRIVRDDTGEIVEERTLRDDEKQIKLVMEEKKEK